MVENKVPEDVLRRAEEVMEDYEFSGGLVIAEEGDEEAWGRYLEVSEGWCCGTLEFVLIGEDGKTYQCGFDYGH